MDGAPTIDPRAAPEARLLSMAPDLLGAAGLDGLLQLVNPAWTTALGWSEEQLRGMAFADLAHPAERAAAERLLAGGDVAGLVCRMRCADGGERPVRWTARASEEDGCVYLAGADVTELAERTEQLERAGAELQDFAYIASHDLAEPLRMVTAYLELLQRRYAGQLDETADEFIGYAVGGAVRMRALIDDLLTYSRVGSHELELVEVDLAGLVTAVVDGLERTVADARGAVQLAEPLAPVRGDATQLGQLVQHLLGNALKFRAPDRPPRVTVASVEDDGGVRLSVTDNGIGIAEAQHERVFKMFARLHGRDDYDGTGIGLAVCRRIADRHGGRLWVESEPGAGSAFHVWLPR